MNFKYHGPIDAKTILDLSPVRTAMRCYLEFVETAFRDAIVKHLGHFPDEETLKQHAHVFITPNGVRHLAWLPGPPVVGEKADFTKVLVSVNPMYFTP